MKKTKKLLSIFLSLCMLLSITAGIDLSAYAETSGDYEYSILDDGTAEITNYNGNDSELIIPDSIDGYTVTSIGYGAFGDCTSLTSIIIPNSVTSIGYYAFAWCTSLTSITIPDSVTSIGAEAFANCKSLTSVTIPNSVTSIGALAFCDCQSLTSITIPDGVTSIGEEAFYHCTRLTSVTIGNGVTSIDDYTFSNCTRLTSITIPDSVTSIEEGAFANCKSLTSVTIPNSVTSIGDYAFYSCTSLSSITIPDSVTSIGEWAFSYCRSLASIMINNPECKIYNSSMTIYDTTVIYGYTDSTAQAYAEKYGRTFVAIDNNVTHQHNYTCTLIEPTCTDTGYTLYTCECGDSYIDEYIPATGHDMQLTEEAVDATVDAAGKTAVYTCANGCGTVEGGEEIAIIPSYTVTVTAQDMGNVTINGVDANDGAAVKVAKAPIGTVTLEASAPEGVEFLGWTANGITLVSTDATFVPTVLANVTYTPVFAKAVVNDFTVTFVDSYGNVIDFQNVASGAEVVEPTAPARAGYTFTGWSMTAEEIAALTDSATVTAMYELAEADGYTVTANGCTITGSGIDAVDEATGVAYDTKVTVTAEGAKSWKIDGVTVAYGESYTFYVGSDVTVVAVLEGDDVATAPTVANVSITNTVDANGKLKWTFLATRSMEGFNCVNFGFVYSKTGATDIDLDKVDDNNIKAVYCRTNADQFSLTYGLSAQSGTVSVRAFVAYVDGNGDTQIVYADTMTKSY